jgi:hypothetical protein
MKNPDCNKSDKEFVINKNTEHLELIKKELPKYDWKLWRIERKSRYWDINTYGDMFVPNHDNTQELHTDSLTWIYECHHNEMKGIIYIGYNGVGMSIDVEFDDRVLYGRNPQKKIISDIDGKWNKISEDERWEKVRTFFETYLIPKDEIVEKKLPSPRIENLISHMKQGMYNYEYDEIMLKLEEMN